ncbi:MAG: carboxymuconolactone decarboxylase family protein [Tannerellaceae bacterium]|nr:carboxymuconolactone decarboxylase family protein [Tannerellaceae bacterium]
MKQWVFILLVLWPVFNSYAQMEKSERYIRGWNKLQEIDGEAGEQVVNSLESISPELARFIIEYSFGDVYSLPSLDNKTKEVAAVSSLIGQGAIPQLKVHLNGALNSGCSINEVKEIILQMSVYTGFPRSINAMNAFKEVLHDRAEKGITDEIGETVTMEDNRDRYTVGANYLSLLSKGQEQVLKDNYGELSPELVQFTIEYGYGDIFSRDNLEMKYRQVATIAALATLGNAQPQLRFHIEGALQIGLGKEEIKEVLLLMTVYAGFPAAINGMNVWKEVMM